MGTGRECEDVGFEVVEEIAYGQYVATFAGFGANF